MFLSVFLFFLLFKNIIRTLGLSDEFTFFVAFNMLTWSNSNEELFHLAQKVHGWGRIHLIDKLEADSTSIKSWLLEEGVNNTILPAYSALTVYDLIDAGAMIKQPMTPEEVISFANLIDALLDEEPCPGISAIDGAKEMLNDFLAQVEKHELQEQLKDVIHHIKEEYENRQPLL